MEETIKVIMMKNDLGAILGEIFFQKVIIKMIRRPVVCVVS